MAIGYGWRTPLQTDIKRRISFKRTQIWLSIFLRRDHNNTFTEEFLIWEGEAPIIYRQCGWGTIEQDGILPERYSCSGPTILSNLTLRYQCDAVSLCRYVTIFKACSPQPIRYQQCRQVHKLTHPSPHRTHTHGSNKCLACCMQVGQTYAKP